MPLIPTGPYMIGTDADDGFISDAEKPQTPVYLETYRIDATTVTNQSFKKFVDETGYQTDAERFGWSFVFGYFLTDKQKEQYPKVPHLKWWYAVEGADWQHPQGPDSHISDLMDHPVIHVSRNDAVAYCQWAGKRLPTEAEWEVAAKGGTTFCRFPWGDEDSVPSSTYANVWQGDFPLTNDLSDGFAGTAPAKYYEPNGYGLYQMIGNVWEWCASPADQALRDLAQEIPQDVWARHQMPSDAAYAIRGGSFLCHPSYCKRYRIAARSRNTAASSASNMSFRCVSL